ncbi:MAG: tryptophan--tRNA ligase, partial [Candidatus Kapaibacterium sp.]
HVATGRSFDEIEREFSGSGYGDFKSAVADAVAEYLEPIRNRYEELRSDKKQLEEILTRGAERANRTAFKTLRKVYKKVGFVSF